MNGSPKDRIVLDLMGELAAATVIEAHDSGEIIKLEALRMGGSLEAFVRLEGLKELMLRAREYVDREMIRLNIPTEEK